MTDFLSNDVPGRIRHPIGMAGGKKTPEKIECGKRLQATREALGFQTLREFAKFLDVGEDRYSKWENGVNYMPVEYAKQLKRKKNVTLEWLYDGDPSGLPHSLALQVTQRAS